MIILGGLGEISTVEVIWLFYFTIEFFCGGCCSAPETQLEMTKELWDFYIVGKGIYDYYFFFLLFKLITEAPPSCLLFYFVGLQLFLGFPPPYLHNQEFISFIDLLLLNLWRVSFFFFFNLLVFWMWKKKLQQNFSTIINSV